MSIVWYFVALVVLIALSAFFSASEMSYSSANRLRLENAAEDGSRRAKTAVGILDHFDRTLSAILIGNNLVNIAASSLGSVIVILLAGEQWTWVSTVVLTLLVIIFGETMPVFGSTPPRNDMGVSVIRRGPVPVPFAMLRPCINIG